VRCLSNQTIFSRIEADIRALIEVTDPLVFNTFDGRSSVTMNGDFVHFQMLINSFVLNCFYSEVIDNYSTFDKSRSRFIETCKEIYRNNRSVLTKIEEFKRTYISEQALHWYTRDSFLYILLNRALRTNDTKLILIFRFFIIDLHKQLAKKYCKPFTEENEDYLSAIYYVYRGQLMQKHELNSLRQSLCNIISMRSFLSTSLNRQMALFYLGESDDPNQSTLVRVLIEIDLGRSNCCENLEKPFANITEHSAFGEAEQEVLFMVGSHFRVDEVRRGGKGVWHVHLTALDILSDPLDKQSKWGTLYHRMQEGLLYSAFKCVSNTGMILFQSGIFDQAQIYYEELLKHLPTLVYTSEEMEDEDYPQSPVFSGKKYENSIAKLKRQLFENEIGLNTLLCFYMLGRIATEKGLFELSISYYDWLLQRTLPSSQMHEQSKHSVSHIVRALCRLGLGTAYELNGQLKRAMASYTKALYMFEQAHDGRFDDHADGLDFTHVHKGHCLVGIGNHYLIEQKYQRADEHYRRALSLFDRYLAMGHPDQTRVRQKIANIERLYRCKPELALEDYKDCLENYLRSLPSDHVDIGRLYTDMASTYEQLPNQLDKALEYAKKAAEILEKNLSEGHTDNITIHMIIKRIERKLC